MRSTIEYSYSILIIRRQNLRPKGLEIVKRLSLTELHVIKGI